MTTERTRHHVSPGLMVALLTATSFVVSYLIELRLFDLRVLFNWDVWFQSDPNVYLDVVTHSYTPAWTIVRHPMAPALGHAVLSSLMRLVSAIGLTPTVPLQGQLWLALLVTPAANALRTFFIFDAFRKIGPTFVVATLLAILDIVAFASISVGSVPESYPLSALGIAMMVWLVYEDSPRARWKTWTLWFLAGACAVGATITNAFAFGVLLAADAYRRDHARSQSIRHVASLLVAVGFTAITMAVAGAGSISALRLGMQQTGGTVRPATSAVATEVAWAVGHTFVAPRPFAEHSWATQAQNPEYNLTWSYSPPYEHGWASWWRMLVTMALTLAGVVGLTEGRRQRTLLVALLAVVLLNVAINLFFGDHFVLYDLHWETALLSLIGGIAFLQGMRRRVAVGMLATFVAITAANSWWLLHYMFSYMTQL